MARGFSLAEVLIEALKSVNPATDSTLATSSAVKPIKVNLDINTFLPRSAALRVVTYKLYQTRL